MKCACSAEQRIESLCKKCRHPPTSKTQRWILFWISTFTMTNELSHKLLYYSGFRIYKTSDDKQEYVPSGGTLICSGPNSGGGT